MIYYFDTEFVESGATLHPISIGIVAEDGREMYLIADNCTDARGLVGVEQATWLQANVFERLRPTRYPNLRFEFVGDFKARILEFIGDDAAPEFWAYYAAHDWVVLCNLMGGMMALPESWPRLCRDLRVELDRDPETKNVTDEGRADEHNALADARWVRDTRRRMLVDPREPGQAQEWRGGTQ